jgi:uncharacterized protein with GYD domain
MPTYVTLANFTEQGLRGIKDTVNRSEAVRKAAGESGGSIKEILWLEGQYDILIISESPDEISATAQRLNSLKAGYIRTQTMRAFTAEEMTKILDKVV